MHAFSLRRFLGGLAPSRFLAEYWQQKPLLVRQALPGFGTWLSGDELRTLAGYEDAESRLVRHRRGVWRLQHGPFTPAQLRALPAQGWSLLVSGVNHFLPEGDALLAALDFVPRARLDDLMVSLAPAGGGVGPHFDSYDVFLIQGIGRRRWEICDQTDLRLVPDAPLRILEDFHPSQSWELEPGDMLYLPPRYAHNGIALETCMTWSVGFRAPGRDEIVRAFYNDLQDHLDLPGLYADPMPKRPRHAGELPREMLAWVQDALRETLWDAARVEDFLGRYLSEPKPHVVFDPPHNPLSARRFAAAVARRGVSLEPRSQLLFRGNRYYLNGEVLTLPHATARLLKPLADQRRLAPLVCDPDTLAVLHAWYVAGFVAPGAD